MGTGLSTESSPSEIGDQLASLGEAYEVYRSICIKNGIDGSQLEEIDDEDLEAYGIIKPHRKRILRLIKDSRTVEPRPPSDPPPSTQSPRKSSLATAATFVAFLSHFKKESGSEARLVQRELKPKLKRGSDQIFLDSDDLFE